MTTPQQFLIYQTEDGSTRIDVMLESETLWLSQTQLTDFFGKAKGTISESSFQNTCVGSCSEKLNN